MEDIILLLFLLSLLIILFYYFRYFIRINYLQIHKPKKTDTKASVIIAVRNAANHIEQTIQSILEQNHANFELIIIDDNSTDDTAKCIQKIKDERISYHKLEEHYGKKRAIEIGIKKSTTKLLLFIDADCIAESRNWLGSMVSSFTNKKRIILAYSRFRPIKYSFLNKIQRFECLLNGIQYLSFAASGYPYMGVGRNLAYHKEVYEKANAFQKHSDVIGGDDDLIINEMGNSDNVAVLMEPSTHTISDAEVSWRSYYYQKRRQLQAGSKYKSTDKIRLAIYGAANVIFYFTYFCLLFGNDNQATILSIFVIKQLMQMLLFDSIMKRLKDRDLLIWLFPLESIYYAIITFIGISTWIWKIDRWK